MFLVLDNYILDQYRPKLKTCSRICTFLAVMVCFIFVGMLVMVAIFSTDSSKKIYVVYMDGSKPKFTTSDKFLSIALDTSIIANGFRHFDLTNVKLIKMMSALSPAYLRIGGTMADRLIFTTSKFNRFKHHLNGELDGGVCSYQRQFCDYLQKPNFTMNGLEWLKLNKLAQEANLEMIFDLNALQRFDNGSWDPTNAERLISFSDEHNLTLNWELGNEPNAFRHQFDYEVNATQLARDFHTVRNIIKKYPKYSKSLLVGPDVTRPELRRNASMLYLEKFLTGATNVIDAVTWHHYYFDGATARVSDFLSPTYLDLFKWQLAAVKQLVPRGKSVWLGETSSAYGGGAPRLSNRYVATFLWLDKLGLSAKHGLEVVIRQSIFQGHYALINDNYTPAPDWWVSILYKKLVSNKVVDCRMAETARVRLYCQCTKAGSYFRGVPSVTVFGINIGHRKARIRFEGVTPMTNKKEMKKLKVHAYVLDTTERIDSRFIYLNDVLLSLTPDNDVPNLKPRIVMADPYVVMPPFSLAFWVVPISENVLPFC